MKHSPRIRPFTATTLALAEGGAYNSVLASIGFERRCREIPEALGVAGLAVRFGDHQEMDYEANLDFFATNGWQMPEIDEAAYFACITEWLATLTEPGGLVRVAADVSSMSRRRIADLVEAVFSLPQDVQLDIDFLYTPAEFEPHDAEREPPIFSVDPVSEYFGGWWSDLDKPLFVIVGLGYEIERAASALDVLEPERAQVYVPQGSDQRYLLAVREANAGLFDTRGVDPREVLYEVADPFACFRRLENDLSRAAESHRVSLIPLGPKIFALAATVAAALHPVDSQVIRVSAGARQEALQRRSDGSLYGLTVSLRPPPEGGDESND
jgi:hypothetical protein